MKRLLAVAALIGIVYACVSCLPDEIPGWFDGAPTDTVIVHDTTIVTDTLVVPPVVDTIIVTDTLYCQHGYDKEHHPCR